MYISVQIEYIIVAGSIQQVQSEAAQPAAIAIVTVAIVIVQLRELDTAQPRLCVELPIDQNVSQAQQLAQ